ASPRRRELLEQAGVTFRVEPADIDESVEPNETPQHAAQRLAVEKAARVSREFSEAMVLAADTVVGVLAANDTWRLLGKPVDATAATEMLECLSGRTHVVCTGIALHCSAHAVRESQVVTTEVDFRTMLPQEILSYVATGECYDKAGGYALQGAAAAFIARIRGSHTNVIGLPLSEVLTLLMNYGLWEPAQLARRHDDEV
ncbi:MAG: septum formation protein Maf, partial [Bdellovibrionales bacterium]|nr:septum formation protein Maf [Bdellovibrionales bacterium]